jgi:hypothetical protein
MALEQEYATYLREKDRLIAEGNEGRYALIRGEKVIDIYNTDEAALEMGYRSFWPESFMVHRIRQVEEVAIFSGPVFLQSPTERSCLT